MLNEEENRKGNILKDEENNKNRSTNINSPMVIVSSPNIKLNYIPIESKQ